MKSKQQELSSQFWDWVVRHMPFAHHLFMRIAEPRVIRLMQFGVYICMAISGVGVLSNPPASFEGVVGYGLVYMLGGFITLGSIFGMVAVLPGIWWLERTAILSMATGLAIYLVLLLALSASPVGISISIAFILTFCQRWSEIKGADLAPRVPKEE